MMVGAEVAVALGGGMSPGDHEARVRVVVELPAMQGADVGCMLGVHSPGIRATCRALHHVAHPVVMYSTLALSEVWDSWATLSTPGRPSFPDTRLQLNM